MSIVNNAGTSQGNEYIQWRIQAELNINATTANPVQCVRFDPFEELVWVGSSTGKVSSFVPANHHPRYSAFVVSKLSPIYCIEPTPNMVFSLSDTELRMNTRQGVPIGKFTSPSMTRMTTCRVMPPGTYFLMGGRQQKLIQYDFVHDKEIRTVDIPETGAVIIRENGSNSFTADESGNVQQRSLTTMEVVHTFPCHGERVLDFDVQGNKMITCGISGNRMKSTDQFIKVYDIRNQKALPPIGLSMPPKFLRFIPSYTERVCCVHQMPGAPNLPKDWMQPANLKLFDLNCPAATTLMFQLDTSAMTAFDISSSKSFLTVGNVSGIVSLYTNRDVPLVNDNSAKTMYVAPPAQPPVSFAIDDTSQSFGQIPMPFPNERLASDWPVNYTEMIHRRKKPTSAHLNAKQVHYAMQIKNPRFNSKLKRHNIVPYFLDDKQRYLEDEYVPPKDDETKKKAPEAVKPPPEVVEGGAKSEESAAEPGRLRVSKLYRKCAQPAPPPFPHRLTVLPEDFTWNLLRYPTLESTFDMNLLANPIVHLFYALSPLRALVLEHICQEDGCIRCELHFLFTAFLANSATHYTTTNLAWALARSGVSLESRNVFHVAQKIFEQLCKEVLKEGTMVNRLERHARCPNCGAHQMARGEVESMISMEYEGVRDLTFVRMLEKAIHLKKSSAEERICEDCGVVSEMKSSRRVLELSPLLLINTNPSSDIFFDFWSRNITRFERKPDGKRHEEAIWYPESKYEKSRSCRWGAGCRSKKCKFSHGGVELAAEQSALLEHVDYPGWRHYLPKRIAVQIYDGITRISDISALPEYDEPTAEVYELDGMVDMISNGAINPEWTHPVTLLRQSPVPSTAWTLINELIVSRLHDHEARRLDAQWKLPLVVAYKKRGFEAAVRVVSVPDEWFLVEKNIGEVESPAIRTIEELPAAGEIVGIDCEFIKIRTTLLDFDSESVEIKEIGRASCVNASGEKIIFDDHVRLASGFEVLDYLTKYSGIVEDHLNPAASDKYLTTHKRLMLRMHVLVQRGVIFVGHALHNDFTVLNVHVPEPQIIDTVNLLRSDERLLSLAFITRHLLGEEIQVNSHDSVIDAQYALKIYRKYLEIKETGLLDDEKKRLYNLMLHDHVNRASPLCISTKRKVNQEKDDSAPRSC